MNLHEPKGWSAGIMKKQTYVPDNCVKCLPTDSIHLTRYCSHTIDVWYSPSCDTFYKKLLSGYYVRIATYEGVTSSGRYPRRHFYFACGTARTVCYVHKLAVYNKEVCRGTVLEKLV